MAKVGRPGKLDPEVLKILCENIEEGMPYKHAAPAAVISYHTIPTMMLNAYHTPKIKDRPKPIQLKYTRPIFFI